MASDLSEETTAEGAATHGIGPFGGDDGGGSCDDDHHGGISTTVMTTKGRPSSSIIGQTINTSIEPKLLLNNRLLNKVNFGLLAFRLSCFLSAYFSLISSFSLGIF
jgi:hypothetical protein